jgi:hypothetical protein
MFSRRRFVQGGGGLSGCGHAADVCRSLAEQTLDLLWGMAYLAAARCSRRKRYTRSPQFSPHSLNATLLTHFDSITSLSRSCQLVFFVCSPRSEVLRIKGFAKSDLLPAEFSQVKCGFL